jgi:hypothetical protein
MRQFKQTGLISPDLKPYNRHEFYFPRDSREAFGLRAYSEDFEEQVEHVHVGDAIVFGVSVVIILIVLIGELL